MRQPLRIRRMLVSALLIMGSACGGATQYDDTEDVRAALRPLGIACEDFPVDPPGIAGCSFSDSVPVRGPAMGLVILYNHPSQASDILMRCVEGEDAMQLLYAEGQRWIGSIGDVAADRRTTSIIDDQSFVDRVAHALDTEVVRCGSRSGTAA